MKPVWTILAAAMAVVASAMAFAQSEETTSGEAALPSLIDLRQVTPVRGDPVAGKQKAELCSACHGTHGIAVVSLFPNLPGQHIDYLYWRLVAFKQGHFPESPMTPPALSLSDTDMRDLAAFYASLDPVAAQRAMDADPDAEPVVAEPAAPAVLARGEQLYRSGDPAKGIPPCQGCHGSDARGFPDALTPDRNGHTPYALFPKLRGQQPDYLQTRLTQYQGGQAMDSTPDLIMNGVGHRLDAESIAALSHYLSSL